MFGCARRTLTLAAARLWKRSSTVTRRRCASFWRTHSPGYRSDHYAPSRRGDLSRPVPPRLRRPRKAGRLPPSASMVPRVCSGATWVYLAVVRMSRWRKRLLHLAQVLALVIEQDGRRTVPQPVGGEDSLEAEVLAGAAEMRVEALVGVGLSAGTGEHVFRSGRI